MTHGRSRRIRLLGVAGGIALLAWVAGPALAGDRLQSGLQIEFVAQNSDPGGDLDLRDEQNRPISDPSAQEELREAGIRSSFQALFAASLPRIAIVLDVLQRFRDSLIRIAFPFSSQTGAFEALAPPLKPGVRFIMAGASSSFAPVLFSRLSSCLTTPADATGRIPLVLRC